ncbi:hypothetical protein ACFY64_24465 [Streptomyces collinus]|uniref:hypothetical protein n=1 Tax=Streptomyces collinus TaxID=42684 RepID=UPI0036A1D900
MIQQMVHTEPGGDPAGVGLALAVARELHPPAGRAPEVAPTAATATRAPEVAPTAATATRAASRSARARRRAARG